MEVARCILLLLQFFLHLLSTYIDLLHLFINQSFLCFFQLVPSISSLVGPVCFSIHFMYHCLHQNIFLRSSQNITIPPCAICPYQLICSFLQSQHVHQFHCILLVHQLYTTLQPHHRSFCS